MMLCDAATLCKMVDPCGRIAQTRGRGHYALATVVRYAVALMRYEYKPPPPPTRSHTDHCGKAFALAALGSGNCEHWDRQSLLTDTTAPLTPPPPPPFWSNPRCCTVTVLLLPYIVAFVSGGLGAKAVQLYSGRSGDAECLCEGLSLQEA